MRGTIAGIVLMVAGATAAPLDAQVTLQPGAKVRITAPTAGVERFKGTVIAAGDTIDVSQGATRVRVPAVAVTRLELSRGKSRLAGARRGALWAMGIGLAVGAVTSERRGPSSCGDPIDPSLMCEGSSLAEWLTFHAAAGALYGTMFGAVVGRERWDTILVPSPARTAMTVRPWVTRDGRVGMAATLR